MSIVISSGWLIALLTAETLWLPFYEGTYEKLSAKTTDQGSTGVIREVKNIETDLPFELQGFDCDNGSEFLNHHLVRYFTDHKPRVKFTRSRPYKKNDNPKLVELINKLYAKQWSRYQNHFCPTLKLVEKKRINSKYYRKYETPRTPFQRLIESQHLSEESKGALRKQNQNRINHLTHSSSNDKLTDN